MFRTQPLGNHESTQYTKLIPPNVMYRGGLGAREALTTFFANCSEGMELDPWLAQILLTIMGAHSL